MYNYDISLSPVQHHSFFTLHFLISPSYSFSTLFLLLATLLASLTEAGTCSFIVSWARALEASVVLHWHSATCVLACNSLYRWGTDCWWKVPILWTAHKVLCRSEGMEADGWTSFAQPHLHTGVLHLGCVRGRAGMHATSRVSVGQHTSIMCTGLTQC